MLDKLNDLENRYSAIEAQLGAGETYDDPQLVARLNREQRELEPVVTAWRSYRRRQDELEQARQLLSDPDMRELAQEEYASARADLETLEQRLKVLLLPRDPHDERNVIVEIRAGVGGEEAALFAHSLHRMYAMYAERQGWRLDVTSASETELGGLKEISFVVEGAGAWSRL